MSHKNKQRLTSTLMICCVKVLFDRRLPSQAQWFWYRRKTVKLVVDYCQITKMVESHNIAMPTAESIIYYLIKANFFTMFDLFSVRLIKLLWKSNPSSIQLVISLTEKKNIRQTYFKVSTFISSKAYGFDKSVLAKYLMEPRKYFGIPKQWCRQITRYEQ